MKVEFIPLNLARDHKWLKHALPIPLTDGTKGIVAMDTDKNRPVAVALFDMWTHTSVCVHWWIGKPMVLRHGFFEEIAKYVFVTCEKVNMIGIIPASSSASLKLSKRLGFKEVGRIKDGYKIGDDQIILQGHIDDAGRWMPLRIEEEEAA